MRRPRHPFVVGGGGAGGGRPSRPLLLLVVLGLAALTCRAFMAVPQRLQTSSRQRRQLQLVRRLAAAAASGPEGDGGGDDRSSSTGMGMGMDEAGSELGGRYDGWGSDAAGSRGYAEESGMAGVADRVQEAEEEEEDPEEAALKERVLRRVAELRREQAAAGGLLAEAFEGMTDAELGIEPLPRSGQANRAFKVSAGDGEGPAVFVKFADVVPGLDGKAKLTKNRLTTEYNGYEELAKHMAHMVPRAYVVDEIEGFLICEYLSDYKSWDMMLRSGKVSADQESVAIQVAQLLGRYHGCCVDNADYNTPEYRERFSNEEHVAFFKSNFVQPLTNTLNDPVAFITKPYLAETLQRLLWGHNEKTGEPNPVGRPGQETEEGKAIRWAVRRLQRSYEFKKQSLVHADTHAQNILVKGEEGQGAEVKLVDAEKSMFGPCGFDMGQFLANFAFYMSQYESEPIVQERLSSAMTLAWAHYEREFLRAMAERAVPPAKAQDVVRGIFNDAVGFMGLWLLFLTTSNPVEVLPFDLPDPGQLQAAHSNLLRMSAALLVDYYHHRPLLEQDDMGLLLDGDEEDPVEPAASADDAGAAAAAAVATEEEEDPEVAAAEAEAAARRRLLGLLDENEAKDKRAAKESEAEGAAEATEPPAVWRQFAMGSSPAAGRTRGNSGFAISGNNMAHVVELLREQVQPLPPPGGLPQLDPAEEEEYMREVVLPADPANPTATRRDPVVYEKDRATRKWKLVDFAGLEEGGPDGKVVDEKTMLMRHQQAQLQKQLSEAVQEEKQQQDGAGAPADVSASSVPEQQQQHPEEGSGIEGIDGIPPNMDDGSAFLRIAENLDEDVSKLQKMMKNSFPAFSAWPQIFGGVAPASPAEGTEAAEGAEGEERQEGDEEEEEEEEEEGEEEEPLMLGGAGFTAPKFTPFPPTSPSARRQAPPTKRQSWGSRGGKGGNGEGDAGGGGGRRRKK